ncbi:MAG: hypothetical protein KDA87_09900 [Planctomycetales bacterium]|nr:hypothetical protein [Planctomycetales bacterium]
MITTCDCDKAFDLLTRGDSLNRDDAGRLDQHLAACHSCRTLAESLRPAVGLFHEALTQDRSNLPVYLGNPQLNWSTVHSTQTTPSDQRVDRLEPTRSSLRPFALAITLSLLAVCVGGGFAGSLPLPRNDEATSTVLHLSLDDIACVQSNWRTLPRAATADASHCCTRCHHSHSPLAISTQQVLLLASACSACHQ